MSHLLYNRVSLTADTTYFMEISCSQVKNQQESKLEGVIKQARNAEYLSACKPFRVTSPVFQQCCSTAWNGSEFDKNESQALWHVAPDPGRPLSPKQPAFITHEEKNTWYNQKQGILQDLWLPQMFLFLEAFIKFLFRLRSDRSQTFSFKRFHFSREIVKLNKYMLFRLQICLG